MTPRKLIELAHSVFLVTFLVIACIPVIRLICFILLVALSTVVLFGPVVTFSHCW